MISILLKAIPIGLLLSIMPGAAFFSILQTSISRGFRAGLFLAIGISLSDIFLVALCVLGIAGLMESSETAQLITGIVGGIVLISFGSYTLFCKKNEVNKKIVNSLDINEIEENRVGILTFVAKGFALNVSNPFVWLLWIGIVPYLGTTLQNQILFLAFILLTIFSMDLIKSFFAGKIKTLLTPRIILRINKIVGFIIVCLGVFLIIRVFFNF